MEYPKALYKDGEMVIVASPDEEEAKRTEGYADWGVDHERMSGGDSASAEDATPAKRAYNRKQKAE